VIARTSRVRGNSSLKTKRADIQLIDKRLDHPDRVIATDVIVQAFGKQECLAPIPALDVTPYLDLANRAAIKITNSKVFTQPRSSTVIATKPSMRMRGLTTPR
jgi:hypothetical protein